MKKTLLFLLAFVTMGEAAKAQTISVADVEALPGETVKFSVNLTGGKDTKYTAFQFDVQFPATGFTTTGKYKVSDAWEGATATVGSVDASGLATIPIASANEIPGTDVEGLVTVEFEVDESVEVGEYDVTLKNMFLAYNTSDKDYPADVTFKVKVVAVHTVELDETSPVAPEAANGVNVKVKRSIKANSWSTICLPFAIPAEKLTAAFGEGVQVKDFTGCDATEEGGETTKLKLKFSNTSAIEANHPYLIKVSQAITSFTVNNVNIVVENEPSIDCDEWRTGSGTKKDPYVYHYNSFVGTYVDQTVVPNLCLFISNDKFYYSTGSTKMKAFRGYFDFYDVLTSVEDAAARITMFDDDATGISNVRTISVESSEYYDLLGRKVENPRKGLYINNGRKVIVK